MKIRDHIIEENPSWVAVNKPAGLLSIPDREGKEISLKQLLREKYGEIFTVHRLDKDTSGLILFARTAEAHKMLSRQFEERLTKKIYLGLLLGTPPNTSGTVTAPIAEHPAKNGTMIIHKNGKEAITDYKVLDDFSKYAWTEFRIHTGRTHQIRVHMKDLGHPIACDPLYGDGKPLLVSSIRSRYKLSRKEEEERPILNRLALHASLLSFEFDGKQVDLSAELPKDLRATLQQLEKTRKKKFSG